jgi:putative Mn2+ efflux pump MntP
VTGRLIALVVPLGLDTLAVSLALGVAGLPVARRLRLALLFAGCEAVMPLIGAGLGLPLGRSIGTVADVLAAALIIVLGVYMLSGLEVTERDPADLLAASRAGVLGAVGLGLSISLDELAIGFSAGLLRVSLPTLVVLVALQAFVATQVGWRLGARVSGRGREGIERLAGLTLLALGLVLLAEQF